MYLDEERESEPENTSARNRRVHDYRFTVVAVYDLMMIMNDFVFYAFIVSNKIISFYFQRAARCIKWMRTRATERSLAWSRK